VGGSRFRAFLSPPAGELVATAKLWEASRRPCGRPSPGLGAAAHRRACQARLVSPRPSPRSATLYRVAVTKTGLDAMSSSSWRRRLSRRDVRRRSRWTLRAAAFGSSNVAESASALPISRSSGVADTLTRRVPPPLPPQVDETEIARQCLVLYDAEDRAGPGPASTSSPPPLVDQWRVRAEFARGGVEAHDARSLKGDALVEGTLRAVGRILNGVALAEAHPRHAFLVVNGSRHFYRASWSLQREGLRHHCVPAARDVVARLDRVEGQLGWKARLKLALARGLAEGAGGEAEALVILGEARELAAEAGDEDLRKECLRVATHVAAVASRGGGGGGAGKKGGGAAKGGKIAGGAATKGADSDAALIAVQEVQSSGDDLTPEAAEERLRAANGLVDPDPSGSVAGVDLAVVGLIAWASATRGILELGEAAAKRALMSKDRRVRARADLTGCLLALVRVEGKFGQRLVAGNVEGRTAVVRDAERICGQFRRLGDPEGVQDAAVLIWNASVPLLQRNVRARVKQPFVTAAQALAHVRSPLHELRAHLHLEIAKLDIDEDAVMKAGEQVTLALSLDYIGTPEEVARTDLARPLDRHLVPLHRALLLKTTVGEEPELMPVEDQAVLSLERARDVKTTSAKEEALERTIGLLLQLDPESPAYPSVPEVGGKVKDKDTVSAGDAAPSSPAMTDAGRQQRIAARARFGLWCEIARVAWSARLSDIVLQVAPFALAFEFRPEVDREAVAAQAELCFLEAEAGILAVRNARAGALIPPADAGYPDELAAGQPGFDEDRLPRRLPPEDVSEIQLRVPHAIVDGVRRGLSVGQPWLVRNGAVLAWNHYGHCIADKLFADLLPFFANVFEAVLAVPSPGIDADLLCCLGYACATGLEHRALIEHYRIAGAAAMGAGDDDDAKVADDGATGQDTTGVGALTSRRMSLVGPDGRAEERYDVLREAAAADRLRLGGNANIERACEVCDEVLQRLDEDTEPLSMFVETAARVSSLAGRPGSSVVGTSAAEGGSKPAAPKKDDNKKGGKDKKGSKSAPPAEDALAGASASVKALWCGAVSAINAITDPEASTADRTTALARAADALSSMEARAAKKTGKEQPDVEMWTKLGRAALEAGMTSEAVQCCKHAMNILPKEVKIDEIDMPEDVTSRGCPVNARLWYWLSLCQNILSQAIMGLIEPAQDAIMQARLRRMGIRHALASVKLGSFCGRRDLVEAGVRLLWNASVDFMNMVVTRRTLAAPFGEAATLLAELGISDPVFAVKFYCALADLMIEAKRPADGLMYVDAAMGAVPAALHMPLLEYKVLFASKLGRDVGDEMLRVANFPAASQARVWLILATESADPADRLRGRQRAVDVLSSEPWNQASYLIELAEHSLHVLRDLPLARGCLYEAIALLLRSDATRLLQGMDAAPLFSDTDPLEELVGRPLADRGLGGAGSQAHSALTPRHLRFPNGWSFSSPQEVEKVALKVAHVESALRAATLLSSILGTWGQRTVAAGAAAVAGSVAARLIAEQVNAAHWGLETPDEKDKREEEEAAMEGRQPYTKVPGFLRSREEIVPSVGPDGAPPLLCHYEAPLDWAAWDVPAEAVQYLSADTRHAFPRMATVTLPRPQQTLMYVRYLLESLDDLGVPVAGLPLVPLLYFSAQQGIEGESKHATARAAFLWQAHLLDAMGLGPLSEAALGRAGDLGQSDSEKAECNNDLAQMDMSNALEKAQKNSKTAGDLGFGGSSPTLAKQRAEEKRRKRAAEERERAAAAAGDRIDPEELMRKLRAGGPPSELRPMTIHDVWMHRAWFLIDRAQYGTARELLLDAEAHAGALGDTAALGEICLGRARIEALANNRTLAVAYAKMAMIHGGDLRFWRRLVVTVSRALSLRAADRRDHGDETVEFIDKCVMIFSALRQLRSDLVWEVGRVLAALVEAKAAVLLERVEIGRGSLEPVDCSTHFNAGMQALQTAVHCYRPMGASPMLSDALTAYATFVNAGNRVPGRQYEADGRPRLRQVQAALREAEVVAGVVDDWIRGLWLPPVPDGGDERGTAEAVAVPASVSTGGDAVDGGAGADGDVADDQAIEPAPPPLPPHRACTFPVTRSLAEVRGLLAAVEFEIGDLSRRNTEEDKRRARPRFPANPEAESTAPIVEWLDATAGHDWDAGLGNFQAACDWADRSREATETHVPRAQGAACYARGASLLALRAREDAQRAQAAAEAAVEAAETAVEEPEPESRPEPEPEAAPADWGKAKGKTVTAPKAAVARPVPTDAAPTLEVEEEEEPEGPPPPPSMEEEGVQLLRRARVVAASSFDLDAACRASEVLACHLRDSGDETGAVLAILEAQSFRASQQLVGLFLDAAAPQALERLKLRQMEALRRGVVAVDDSSYYRAAAADRASVSVMADLLDPVLDAREGLAAVPDSTDVLCLYLGTDDRTLFVAIRRQRQAAVAKKIKSAPGLMSQSNRDLGDPEEPATHEFFLRTVEIEVPKLKEALSAYQGFRRAVELGFVQARNTYGGANADGSRLHADLDRLWAERVAPWEAQMAPVMAAVEEIGGWKDRGLLLVADVLLARGPLEALPALQDARWVARDFSLALLLKRAAHAGDPPHAEAGAGNPALLASPAAKKGKDKGRDAGAKGGAKGGAAKAAVPKASAGADAADDLPAGTLPPGADVRVGALSFLVDLRAEDDAEALPGRSSPTLVEAFKQGPLRTVGKAWKGVLGGGDRVAGEDECVALLEAAPGVVYLGVGRFGSIVSPRAVASADLRGCRLVLVLDGVMNEELDRRQSSADLRKTTWELTSEGAIETAAVLSLRGASAVVVNLAACSPDACLHLAELPARLKGAGKGGGGGGGGDRSRDPTLAGTFAALLADLPPGLARYHSTNAVLYGLPNLKAGG